MNAQLLAKVNDEFIATDKAKPLAAGFTGVVTFVSFANRPRYRELSSCSP